jgi:hypothetical protein
MTKAGGEPRARRGLGNEERLIWLLVAVLVAALAVVVDRQSEAPQLAPCVCECRAPPSSSSSNTSEKDQPAVVDYKMEWLRAAAGAPPPAPSLPPALPPFGLMRMLWQTPIYQVSLSSFLSDVPAMNARVGSEIKRHFDLLLDTNRATVDLSGWKENGINQVQTSNPIRFWPQIPPAHDAHEPAQ